MKACVDNHRELMQRPDLNTSLDQAWLQLQWELCGGGGQLEVGATPAAANFYKLLGAHEFIRTFKSLAEPVRILPKPDSGRDIHETFK